MFFFDLNKSNFWSLWYFFYLSVLQFLPWPLQKRRILAAYYQPQSVVILTAVRNVVADAAMFLSTSAFSSVSMQLWPWHFYSINLTLTYAFFVRSFLPCILLIRRRQRMRKCEVKYSWCQWTPQLCVYRTLIWYRTMNAAAIEALFICLLRIAVVLLLTGCWNKPMQLLSGNHLKEIRGFPLVLRYLTCLLCRSKLWFCGNISPMQEA